MPKMQTHVMFVFYLLLLETDFALCSYEFGFLYIGFLFSLNWNQSTQL